MANTRPAELGQMNINVNFYCTYHQKNITSLSDVVVEAV